MKTHIERVKLADLELLDKNPHYMSPVKFRRLVENVRVDGCLTSVPLVWTNPTTGKRRVLSGNHRVMAAREAGVEEADVMVVDEELSEAQLVAIQLSHNALIGDDDPAGLKALYESIDDVDWRAYAGLDDKTLQLLDAVEVKTAVTAKLDFSMLTVVFLPDEQERLEAVFGDLADACKGNTTWLARFADHDRVLDLLDAAARSRGVTNQAVAVMALCDVVERHLESLDAGWLDENGEAKGNHWVPLSTVFGVDSVPAPVAAMLRRAVDTMVTSGDITTKAKWRLLELLAADYLAGGDNAGPES